MIVKRDNDWEVKPTQGETELDSSTKLSPEQIDELKRKILLRKEQNVEETKEAGTHCGWMVRLKHWFHR